MYSYDSYDWLPWTNIIFTILEVNNRSNLIEARLTEDILNPNIIQQYIYLGVETPYKEL